MAELGTTAKEVTGTVCPTCGADGFKNTQGMKSHHAQAHGESIHGVEYECDTCGEKSRMLRSAFDDRDHHFCSVDCRAAWESERRQGVPEKLPERFTDADYLRELYHGQGLSSVEIAKKAGVTKTTVLDWMNRLEIERRSVEAGEGHLHYNQIEVSCETCGAPVLKPPSKVEFSDHHFCSMDCRTVWQRETWVGEGSPAWKGGTDRYYGPNYPRQRRKALERDGGCAICGMENDEHRERFGEALHCHHITRIRYFQRNYDAPEWYELGNALDNLIMLCEPHHRRWEGVPLRPDTA